MGYKKIKISKLDNAVYVDEARDIMVVVTGHGTGTSFHPDEMGNTDGTAATRIITIDNLGPVRNVRAVGDGYSIVSGIQGQNIHFKGITGLSGIYVSGTDGKTDTREYSIFASGLHLFQNLGGGHEVASHVDDGVIYLRTLYGTGDVETHLSKKADRVIIDSRSAPTYIISAETSALPFLQETVYKIASSNINPTIGLETGIYNKNGTSAIIVTNVNTKSVTLKSLGANVKRKVIHKQLGDSQYLPGEINYIFLKYVSGSQNICATDTPSEISPNLFYSIYAPRPISKTLLDKAPSSSTARRIGIRQPSVETDLAIIERPKWSIPEEAPKGAPWIVGGITLKINLPGHAVLPGLGLCYMFPGRDGRRYIKVIRTKTSGLLSSIIGRNYGCGRGWGCYFAIENTMSPDGRNSWCTASWPEENVQTPEQMRAHGLSDSTMSCIGFLNNTSDTAGTNTLRYLKIGMPKDGGKLITELPADPSSGPVEKYFIQNTFSRKVDIAPEYKDNYFEIMNRIFFGGRRGQALDISLAANPGSLV